MEPKEIDGLLLAYDTLESIPDTQRLFYDPDEKEPNYGNAELRIAFQIGWQAAIDSDSKTCGHVLGLSDDKPCVIAAGVKHSRHVDSSGAYWPVTKRK